MHTHRGRRVTAEAEVGVTQPQAAGRQGPAATPEAWKRRGAAPRPVSEGQPCGHPCARPAAAGTARGICSALSPAVSP